ncbi:MULTISPECIES: RNA polymerase sigma factor [unclassified Pseudoclavibacter]|uniref:RNA polymerase sigma factor n=1 Tax=unclassified Pseudoclavibacter TaxID=2615177 RepID=UPI0012F170EB|nr:MULTISPECIES: sigma-70 family RNA polymerase sigma factor [unclassified Pseudoclavibacter]MBF4458958.1 sigma-70 family RNA polymerase sigma factor [Pseudoclavibacter sp. VKM Ac-2867]VXB93666.1 RNA polymerase subunit sigma-70 [Pseudoclavibacter sp. 8L]
MPDLAEAPDALLVARARDGDQRAFEVLIRRHWGLMIATAIRLLSSRADAEDAVQDACIVAWKRLDLLREPSAVRAWLVQIAARKATDLLRKRKFEQDIDDVEAPAAKDLGPSAQLELNAKLDAASRILGTLPELQRQCWVLKETAGFTYAEIAEQLETNTSTVRGALSRARLALLRGMEEWA